MSKRTPRAPTSDEAIERFTDRLTQLAHGLLRVNQALTTAEADADSHLPDRENPPSAPRRRSPASPRRTALLALQARLSNQLALLEAVWHRRN